MIELYPWQKECLNTWKDNHDSGIINVITGAGKTYMAIAAAESVIKHHPGKTCVRVVVPTVSLALQWKRDISSYFFERSLLSNDIGLYYGTVKSSPERLFTIYVVNSARNSISSHILNDMDHGIHTVLICDECHHYSSPKNANIFSFRKSARFNKDLYHSIGLSATPYNPRFDEVLVPALGREIYRYYFEQAKNDNRINDFAVIETAINLSGDEAVEYGKITDSINRVYARMIAGNKFLKELSREEAFHIIFEYAAQDPESLFASYVNLVLERRNLIYNAQARTQCVTSIISGSPQNEKIILFSERIDLADKLYSELRDIYGRSVIRYHSEIDKHLRKEYLDLYRIGEARILVTCKALDEGLDVPDTSVGIIVSGSSVNRQRIQRLGRILRPSDSKGMSVLYYIYAAGTVEDNIFLDDLPNDTKRTSVQFDPKSNRFYNQRYDLCAAQYIKSLKKPFGHSKKLELEQCLVQGEMKADWLLSPEVCRHHYISSTNQHESNYWFVMEKISEINRSIS